MFKSKTIRNLWLFDFLADFCAIVAAYYLALLFRFHSVWGEKFFTAVNQMFGIRETSKVGYELEVFYETDAPRIIIFLTVTLCVLYALRELYSGRRFLRKRPLAWNVVAANVTALALFYVYFYLRRNIFHPRSFFAMVIFLNVFFCVAFRNLINRLLRLMQSRFGIDQSFAVLIGLNEEADFLKVFIDDLQPHGIRIAGRMEFDSAFAEAMSDKPEEPFEKFIGKLEGSIREHNANMIISADKRLSLAQIMQILELADRLDVAIKILSDKMDVIMNQARMPVDMVHGVPLVHFEIPSAGGMGMPERVRRGLSIAFGYLATAVLFPGMGLMALLIRLTSQGPVFFIQERIGVNRKPFRMYKFRTMYDRADEAQAEMEEFNESGRGLFKIRKDPRVTPVGRFLRRFSLDELPQLINVIRGEMVIVGPRP